MIISKDLQEILEGVHYFLSETLAQEPLPGKVECLRRGLVIQLEALVLSYPTLRIRARSSVSLPYLAMDQGQNQTIHRKSESLSSASSGTNSYSNSSSGDGLVMGSGRVGCIDLQQTASDTHSTLDEEYEDFQDNKETKPHGSNGVLKEEEGNPDDIDDNEDVYMETLDAVAFSTIIASCDRHGVLSKKTKGLLRNMKNYHCVAANGKLYLYLKETDERQRKTIDLTGYVARSATGEDIKDQRKRDSAFEIVGPGKKTHTFIARTARDKGEWLVAFGRTIRTERSKTLPSMSSLSGLFSTMNTDQNALIIPPSKGTPVMTPIMHKENDIKTREEDFYYHDVADDAKEEVYEVVGPEGTVFGRPVGGSESFPPPQSCQSTDLEDYDPVSPEDVPPPLPQCPPPSTLTFGRRPPERPPLPLNIRDRINKQASRPLPDAPKDATYNSYDPGGIYCEIEEDLLENYDETPTGEYKNFSGNTNYINRNIINQDSKKPRAVSADGLPHDSGSLSPSLSSRASTNSLVGSFSDEILSNMNISDPNLSQQSSHKYNIRPTSSLSCKTPPRLPPKGVPLPPVDDDDNEYKVPSSTIMDAEYQIPPNPIPTGTEMESVIHEISGPIPDSSQMYQVPPSQTIVPIKPKKDRRNSIIEESSKPLSSFLNENNETQPKNSFKSITKPIDKKDPRFGRDFRDKPSSQGTSVKDMIARLNKNKAEAEKNTSGKEKETLANTGNTQNDKIDNDALKEEVDSSEPSNPAEVKSIKPNLPPRPSNLLNKITVTAMNSLPLEEDKKPADGETIASEADDDYYETPEGNSFDSSSQQGDSSSTSKEVLAQWKTKQDLPREPSVPTGGEWYVAKFAFVATIDQALGFNRGDPILVHETNSNSGWWKATVKGRSGVVPKEYLKKKES